MLGKPAAGTELHVWKKKMGILSDEAQALHNNRAFNSKQSYCLFLLDFNTYWRENDVTVLKANLHFPFMAQKVHDSEKLIVIERNTKRLL